MSGIWSPLTSEHPPEVLRIAFCREALQKNYALDVAYGQLARKRLEDKRVVVIERTKICYYDGADLNEQIDVAVIDASFISLQIVSSAVLKFLALIKPQFEATKEEADKDGVIKDALVQERVLREISEFCESLNQEVEGACPSPILDSSGSKEFFILARRQKDNGDKNFPELRNVSIIESFPFYSSERSCFVNASAD